MNVKTKKSYYSVYFTFHPYIFLFYISLYTIALVIECVLEFLISPCQVYVN